MRGQNGLELSPHIFPQSLEIGVRKVLGASSGDILILLLREFAVLIIIASLLAWCRISLVAKEAGDQPIRVSYHLQPLSRVHLYSKADYGIFGTGDIAHIILLSKRKGFVRV